MGKRQLATLPIEDTAAPAGQLPAKRTLGSTGSYGAASVGVAATQIVAANSGRRSLLMRNSSATVVYIGLDASVTTASGVPLNQNDAMVLDNYTGAVYGIVAAGSADVRYLQESD